jgi:hypothetical protein
MAESIDWTDETLRSLDDLARIAFPPDAGVTADTLKRRARKGQLTVYRPGKAYLASLAGVWAMVQATRVQQKPTPAQGDLAGRRFGAPTTERVNETQARVLAKLDALRGAPKRAKRA